MKIRVIGSGSWGTALASTLALNGHPVMLIGRDPAKAGEINARHTNSRYLPGVTLPQNLAASTNIAEAAAAEVILFVVPTSATRPTLENLSAHPVPEKTILVSCAKGIERETGKRMSQIIAEHFPRNPLAALSGPNHAEEVARRLATCTVIASRNEATALRLQKLFANDFFRAYTSQDIVGLELGGAIKNVFALAAGGADGLGLGDNAISALVTRGLAEMTRLGTALGGQPSTFSGLSGVGDLIATC